MVRPMRRALVVLLALVAVLAASGCGGSEEAAPTAETVIGTLPEAAETGGAETGEAGEGGEGDPEAGSEVFASAGCGSCHTLSDAGTSGNIGPNLDEAQPDMATVVDAVTNGRGAMPPFEGQLDEEQIRNVAAYVSSVAGS
jgi:mono/diheme cytochrome c family protein